jgi:hypothetical protein
MSATLEVVHVSAITRSFADATYGATCQDMYIGHVIYYMIEDIHMEATSSIISTQEI